MSCFFCLFVFVFNSKTTEILSLVTLVTNYQKLWSDPDENLGKKIGVKF